MLSLSIFVDGRLVHFREVSNGESYELGADSCADIVVPSLKYQFILTIGDSGCELSSFDNGSHNSRTLGVDHLSHIEGGTTLLLTAVTQSDERSTIIGDMLSWMRLPMRDKQSLAAALESFLDILIERSRASNGVVALKENDSFRLIGTRGISLCDAHKAWSKVPDGVYRDILKNETRIILPDSLSSLGSRDRGDTTVFVKGIQSFIGLPIVAEESVIAVLLLGFENMIRDFSESIQAELIRSCEIAGIVLQRGLLREQFNQQRFQALTLSRHSSHSERAMLGRSKELDRAYKSIEKFAPVDLPVLISGETGTGKDLAAREVHRHSSVANGPFVVVNAGALQTNLIESELFGHKKGSFTGAVTDKAGIIEQANNGTLFIDEIGELPPETQTKFLRVLQDQSFSRIGETRIRRSNFRLISATHRDLRKLIKEGQFREDLYYRIAGCLISLPPLRDRREDIILLADYFKQRFCQIHGFRGKEWSSEAIGRLLAYSWPGNIRELEHVVTRAVVISDQLVINKDDIETEDRESRTMSQSYSKGISLSMAKQEWMRRFLTDALLENDGNRIKTAAALNIGQRTLFRYIDQYNIQV